MNNKLIKKEDVTIFDKIRNFFKKLLKNNKKKDIVEPIKEEKIIKNDKNFEENLKVNITDINEKEKKFNDFIEKIEDNPDLLEKLPEKTLDNLISYYERITKEKELKIKKLKESLN